VDDKKILRNLQTVPNIIRMIKLQRRSRYSSGDTVTRLWAGGLGSRFKTSRPNLEPTQPHILCVPWGSFPGGKAAVACSSSLSSTQRRG
jgi:hypothetical protein